VPCRGIRGAKSKVLHKEVVDKYKIQKLRELEQVAHTKDGLIMKVHVDPDMVCFVVVYIPCGMLAILM